MACEHTKKSQKQQCIYVTSQALYCYVATIPIPSRHTLPD